MKYESSWWPMYTGQSCLCTVDPGRNVRTPVVIRGTGEADLVIHTNLQTLSTSHT